MRVYYFSSYRFQYSLRLTHTECLQSIVMCIVGVFINVGIIMGWWFIDTHTI